MTLTQRIFVRVTWNQRERIENDSQVRGFQSVSQYLRSLALEMDGATVRKIDDIYRNMVPITEKSKTKERPLSAYF